MAPRKKPLPEFDVMWKNYPNRPDATGEGIDTLEYKVLPNETNLSTGTPDPLMTTDASDPKHPMKVRKLTDAELASDWVIGASGSGHVIFNNSDRVAQDIGGEAWSNYKKFTNYRNTCTLRMSRCFNYSGIVIKRGNGLTLTNRGTDGKAYAIRVKEFTKYLKQIFGAPTISVTGSQLAARTSADGIPSEIKGKKGIIVFDVTGWGNAAGHVTLWDGDRCKYGTYFTADQLHGATLVGIYLWENRHRVGALPSGAISPEPGVPVIAIWRTT